MTEKHSAQNWQRFELADFGNPALAASPARNTAPSVAGKLGAEQNEGFQKGYSDGLKAGRAEGFAAGQAAGIAEGKQAARKLLSIAAKLDTAVSGIDQEIAQEILALSLEVARQIMRQTVAIKPETVLSVVQDALNQIPHQHASIYLHPEDAELVRNLAGEQLGHIGHRIHEDARLLRGDVMIEAAGAQIDATLATRWRRIVEGLGGEASWGDLDGT